MQSCEKISELKCFRMGGDWFESHRNNIDFVNELLATMNEFLNQLQSSNLLHLSPEMSKTLEMISAFALILYVAVEVEPERAYKISNPISNDEIQNTTQASIIKIRLLPFLSFKQDPDRLVRGKDFFHKSLEYYHIRTDIRRKFDHLNSQLDCELSVRLSEILSSAYPPYRIINKMVNFSTTELIERVLTDLRDDPLSRQLTILFKQYDNLDSLDPDGTSLIHTGRQRFMAALFAALKKNKTLKGLDLTNAEFTYSEFNQLCQAIYDMNQPFKLNIFDTYFPERHVMSLCELIKKNQNLIGLTVLNSGLTDTDFGYLCNVLMESSSLRRQKFAMAELTDTRAPVFFNIIRFNKYLVSIDLFRIDLNKNFAGLCEVLAENKTILSLKLYGNNLPKQSSVHIGNMLKKNQHLRNLELGDISLNDEDIINLCHSLWQNTSLNRLALDITSYPNRVDARVILLCKELTAKNKSVHSLRFYNGNLSEKGLLSLSNALKKTHVHFMRIPMLRDCKMDRRELLYNVLNDNRNRDHYPLRAGLVLLSFLTDTKGVAGTFPVLHYDVLRIIIQYVCGYRRAEIDNLRALIESKFLHRTQKVQQPIPIAASISLGIQQEPAHGSILNNSESVRLEF